MLHSLASSGPDYLGCLRSERSASVAGRLGRDSVKSRMLAMPASLPRKPPNLQQPDLETLFGALPAVLRKVFGSHCDSHGLFLPFCFEWKGRRRTCGPCCQQVFTLPSSPADGRRSNLADLHVNLPPARWRGPVCGAWDEGSLASTPLIPHWPTIRRQPWLSAFPVEKATFPWHRPGAVRAGPRRFGYFVGLRRTRDCGRPGSI